NTAARYKIASRVLCSIGKVETTHCTRTNIACSPTQTAFFYYMLNHGTKLANSTLGHGRRSVQRASNQCRIGCDVAGCIVCCFRPSPALVTSPHLKSKPKYRRPTASDTRLGPARMYCVCTNNQLRQSAASHPSRQPNATSVSERMAQPGASPTSRPPRCVKSHAGRRVTRRSRRPVCVMRNKQHWRRPSGSEKLQDISRSLARRSFQVRPSMHDQAVEKRGHTFALPKSHFSPIAPAGGTELIPTSIQYEMARFGGR
ncbi:hypothetical protein IQ06DRAFT_365980, partial [Phaeosphaeriaceae sp. SRC1lsM3a]